MRKIMCSCFAALLLAGCGKKKEPKEYMRDAAEKLTGIKTEDIERIKHDLLQLKTLYEAGAFDGLKDVCAELDQRFNQRILTWYAEILLIEHTRGVDAAKEEIQRLKKTVELSAKEVRALDDIEGYYRDKGEMPPLASLCSCCSVATPFIWKVNTGMVPARPWESSLK